MLKVRETSVDEGIGMLDQDRTFEGMMLDCRDAQPYAEQMLAISHEITHEV